MKIRNIALALMIGLFAVTGYAQDTATKSLTLTVNPAAISVSPTTLPGGMVGLVYTTSVSGVGGVGPYTFAVSSGTLPAGVTLSAAGAFSGTPTTAGSSTFTVKVTDSETPAATGTQSFTVSVVPALTITNTTLPAANIGVAYTTTITATGGVAPYTFAVTTGSLPAGLTLNGTSGVISGTPTAAGSFTFTVTVTDSATNIVRVLFKSTIQVASIHTGGPRA